MESNNLLNNRYQVQSYLGNKANQNTVLAKDLQTQNLVVVKLFIFGNNADWNVFKLFEREALTLKMLSHPAIPNYLDYFEVDCTWRGFLAKCNRLVELETKSGKGFALVQTHIKAIALSEHIKQGRTFTEDELKQIATAILEILIYLHDRHPPIIHRDLKPENILLDDRSGNQVGKVYLVDFGSVQAAANKVGTRTVVGTYGYMPPEQFGGRAVPASDLYSLGATIIYLASGKHPADLPQREFKLCFEEYVNLTPNFRQWLQKVSKPNLDGRTASAKEALETLNNLERQFADLSSNPIPLSLQKKPRNSRVVLSKKSDRLEIYLPPKGFSLALLPIIGFAAVWNGFLVFWYAICFATWNSGGLFMGCFALLHLAAGLFITLGILFAIWGKIRLVIDVEQIALTYKLFGIKYRSPKPTNSRDIIKLERTKLSYSRDSDGDRTTIKPQINIWAGTKKFSFGNNDLLTEVELDWLASELSQWLNLPIS